MGDLGGTALALLAVDTCLDLTDEDQLRKVVELWMYDPSVHAVYYARAQRLQYALEQLARVFR